MESAEVKHPDPAPNIRDDYPLACGVYAHAWREIWEYLAVARNAPGTFIVEFARLTAPGVERHHIETMLHRGLVAGVLGCQRMGVVRMPEDVEGYKPDNPFGMAPTMALDKLEKLNEFRYWRKDLEK